MYANYELLEVESPGFTFGAGRLGRFVMFIVDRALLRIHPVHSKTGEDFYIIVPVSQRTYVTVLLHPYVDGEYIHVGVAAWHPCANQNTSRTVWRYTTEL